jgi:hypothetical protein
MMNKVENAVNPTLVLWLLDVAGLILGLRLFLLLNGFICMLARAMAKTGAR